MKFLSPVVFLFLCTVILLPGCTNMHADLKTGQEARRAGDYDTAIRHLAPLADFGVNDAKYELGIALMRQDNPSQAAYEKARTVLLEVQGRRKPAALFEVGRIYYKGLGVEKDIQKTKDYYTASGDLGYQRAYYELARILMKEKDFINAEGLCKHAFLRHYDRAAMCIGRLYEKGWGRSVNRQQALAWYMVAQRRNVSRASEKVAELSTHLGPQAIAQAEELATGIENNEEDN